MFSSEFLSYSVDVKLWTHNNCLTNRCYLVNANLYAWILESRVIFTVYVGMVPGFVVHGFVGFLVSKNPWFLRFRGFTGFVVSRVFMVSRVSWFQDPIALFVKSWGRSPRCLWSALFKLRG